MPHEALRANCPTTGNPIPRPRDSSSREPRASAADAEALRPTPRSLPAVPAAPSTAMEADRFAPARLVGRTLGGRYAIRRILGEGGMGTVYEGECVPIGRSVAVKVLHPRQALKTDAVHRFRREARAAAAIGHPNICEVYDFGTHTDGSPYLVMELLMGETLADRIACEGGLPFDEVVEILIQVLSGLIAAHEKGIVHRDIKPENVFLSRRPGQGVLVKLLDFGVSKMVSPLFQPEDTELTRAGMVMGTPYYLSPEQARGDRDLDGRVDLFACGVILYEALTGFRPFGAPNYNSLLIKILSAEPLPARIRRPALPDAIDSILTKAMAKDREGRYISALAFQRELRSLRERQPVGAANVGAEDVSARSYPSTTPCGPPSTDSLEIPIAVASEAALYQDDADDAPDPTEPSRRIPEHDLNAPGDEHDPAGDEPTVRMPHL